MNEDPTEALIRELKEQNEKLKAQLESGNVDMNELRDAAGKDNLSKEELKQLKAEWLEEMKANLNGNEKEMNDMRLSYEEKLLAAQKAATAGDHALARVMEEKKTKPHLFNLNFDPQLSGRIVHILQKPETEIGNRKGQESDICMVGPG